MVLDDIKTIEGKKGNGMDLCSSVMTFKLLKYFQEKRRHRDSISDTDTTILVNQLGEVLDNSDRLLIDDEAINQQSKVLGDKG